MIVDLDCRSLIGTKRVALVRRLRVDSIRLSPDNKEYRACADTTVALSVSKSKHSCLVYPKTFWDGRMNGCPFGRADVRLSSESALAPLWTQVTNGQFVCSAPQKTCDFCLVIFVKILI